MANSICKIRDRYLVWSSIVDAPITPGMTRAEVLQWLLEEFGRANYSHWFRAVDEATGEPDSFCCNRAGKDERRLNIDGVWRRYVELACCSRGRNSPDDLPCHLWPDDEVTDYE